MRAALTSAESQTGAGRRAALTALATRVTGYAPASSDGAKVRLLATGIRDLAAR